MASLPEGTGGALVGMFDGFHKRLLVIDSVPLPEAEAGRDTREGRSKVPEELLERQGQIESLSAGGVS